MRQAGWLVAATILSGGLNYLTNAAFGRILGPAEYGVYAAVLSLYTTCIALTGVVQIVVTNYAARLAAANDWPAMLGMALSIGRVLVLTGLVAGTLMIFGSGIMAKALHFAERQPLWVLAAAMLPLALIPLVLGLLAGQQRFGSLGMVQVWGSAIRLLSGLVLLRLGTGATGAVASLACAAWATATIGGLSLSNVWRYWQERHQPKLEALGSFVLYAALGTMGFALLTGMDVLIVKGRFLPMEAGLYASVSTVGKITLWITGALGMFLLPKAASRHAREQETSGLLRGTQACVLLLGLGMAILFYGLSVPLMHLVFGAGFLAEANLLGPYGLAMAVYSVVGIWFNYFLAVRYMQYTWILLAGVATQVVVLVRFCSTLSEIVWAMLGVGLVLVVCGEASYRHSLHRRSV